MEYSTFGKHIALDAWGISFELLNDVKWLAKHLVKAANLSGATVLSVQEQQFQPQGATVLVMLSESHLSIHTYPEKGFAALDCYTCGYTVEPMKAIQYMIDVLKPSQTFSKLIKRGMGTLEVIQPDLSCPKNSITV